jgi:hypothetical protein
MGLLKNKNGIKLTPKLSLSFRAIFILSSICAFAIIGWFVFFQLAKAKNVFALSPGVNLNQARNGTDSIPVSPMNWVNGNIGTGTAHYVESWSVPYQCIMSGLTVGVQVTLVVGYDIKNSGRNGIDFLTHYNRVMPHIGFTHHSTPETIDPLAGTGLAPATPFTTRTIPAPSSAGSPVTGQPTACFNSLPAGEKLMTLYNGTIDSIYYVIEGSLTATNAETQVAIKFTPTASTAVLVWGGHLADRNVWGYTSGVPNSAGGISGSPFHSRLDSWTLGSLGSTDRSVSGATVSNFSSLLPITLVNFNATVSGKVVELKWATASEVNNDYFTLERSVDGINFIEIAHVKGEGNSTTLENYEYTDENPVMGQSYYRLMQTDYDGHFESFNTIAVAINDKGKDSWVSVAPNPFTDSFTASFLSELKQQVTVSLVSMKGETAFSKTFDAVKGSNILKCDLPSSLSKGVYQLHISNKEKILASSRVVRN